MLKKFKGWKQSLKKCRSYEEMPQAARDYVDFIETFTNTPVGIISVGYEREETFVRENPWTYYDFDDEDA